MNKYKQKITYLLLCSVVLAGVQLPVKAQEGSVESVEQTESLQNEEEPGSVDEAEGVEIIPSVLTTGRSLNEEQLAETIEVLGAQHVAEDNQLEVWGSDIDRYTGNGSSDESMVFSSALIEFMHEGYGVTVKVVTPENITEVSAETYANAAITAGGKDLDIKIANVVVPVNGRGALAGIYLAMEHAGIEINQEDIEIAELEVGKIEEVQIQTGLTDEVVNLSIADMKRQVAVYIVEGKEINDDSVQEIIRYVEEQQGLEFPEETVMTMSELLLNFSKTKAAQDTDLDTTLHQYTETVLETGGQALEGLESTITVQEERNWLQRTGDNVNGFFKGVGDFFTGLFS